MISELTFTARVAKRCQITIPRAVREDIGIMEGDVVEVRIKRIKIKGET